MKSRVELLDKIPGDIKPDTFLITSPRSVQHLCGYFFDFENGPSPFQLIPAALLVFPSREAYLVIADNETGQLNELNKDITTVPYASYTFDKPLDYSNRFNFSVLELIKRNGRHNLKIGIEPGYLPVSVINFLRENYPDIQFTDITAHIAGLRLIKDEVELSMIRDATHLCDVGQSAVLKYARPGITEIDLFNLVRGDIETAAGKRIPIMADLVSGQRTGEGGGNPSAKIINPGDLILSDLTPCLNGYWGDTCNTMAIGKPGKKQRELFLKIKETLELGLDAIKPGIRASEIDNLMRRHLATYGEYNHHSGHGVGLAYHEEPRIVPYNDSILQPNMVIALEPGIYKKEYGIRLEHIAAVTRSGCEVLSKFDPCFEN